MPREWNHHKQPGPTALEALRRVIPRDRAFTLPEVIPLAQAAMLPRKTPASTIRKGLRLLESYGEVCRVRRIRYGSVEWTVCDGAPGELPLAAMRLPDAAEMLLRLNGPMRGGAGYHATAIGLPTGSQRAGAAACPTGVLGEGAGTVSVRRGRPLGALPLVWCAGRGCAVTEDKLRSLKVVNRLPDLGGHHEAIPNDLKGATIIAIGTFEDQSLVETGGLAIDYLPEGGKVARRIVLAFNDVAMWISASY